MKENKHKGAIYYMIPTILYAGIGRTMETISICGGGGEGKTNRQSIEDF